MIQPAPRRRRTASVPLLGLLATAVAACGSGASQLPATGAVGTAPAAAPAPTAAALRPAPGHGCRLPLTGRAGAGAASGFVQLADGRGATSDPRGQLLGGGGGDPRSRTAVAPVLHGAPGATPSYTPAAGRWVPAPPAAVAPDGLRYAYAAGDGVHLVEIGSAADRVIGGGGDLEVLAFAGEGVYAVHRRPAGPGAGLELLEPASGAVRILRPDEPGVEWAAAGGGAAWAVAGLAGGADEVWRLDRPTGTLTVWLHRLGTGLRLVGVDAAGHPLVQLAAPQSSSVWLVSAPGAARQVSESAPGGDDTPGYPAAVTDAGGVWVSDDGGTLYRFSPSTGMRRVDVPRLLASAQRVAGGCS